ncbi:MAG: hypothetical protein ACKVQW_07340 [Pyrinomonadaceae bacterium]
MSYYAIGFGGTGAKCIEALIHLCAAGMMPDDQELYILFVDQDDDNGSLGRAQKLLKIYKKCRTEDAATVDFLRSKIVSPKKDNWLPEEDKEATLLKFVQYSNLTTEFKHMFDVLYDKKEKTTEMGKGFRGHPSIGAAVFAATVDLDSIDPWKEIKGRLEKETDSRIMFFGSIFGGTGAAGVPTISRLFNNWREIFPKNPFRLGSVLTLPYFTFKKNEQDELHADARDFAVNTQTALQYYQQQDYMGVFDKAYLLGCDDPRDMGKAEIGSQNQVNPPHWVEVYAAMAAIDFFKEEKFIDDRYNLIGRKKAKVLDWTDLPYKSVEARKKITSLLRFAFAYHAVYLPAIKKLRTEKNAYWAPWFVDFFKRPGVEVQSKLDNELNPVDEYCEQFLKWLAGIEYSITGNTGTNFLADYASFAELTKDDDDKLEITLRDNFILSKFADFEVGDQKKKVDLMTLWERMCERYSVGTDENGSRKFVSELYRQCGQ